jgi:Protein of unknown function (DUF2971)
MPNLRTSIGNAIAEMQQEADFERRRAERLAEATQFRFAWAAGHETLYKFMRLSGDGFGYVVDVLENSRVYFSSPDQLNDPADCRPVFKLGGDLTDPAFLQELHDGEARIVKEKGLTPEQVTELQAKHGVSPEVLADSVTAQTCAELERIVRVYCLTTEARSPYMWSNYADKQNGVCLHFRSEGRFMAGSARQVNYTGDRKPILIPLEYNASQDEIMDRMVFDKAACWASEGEYRIIGHDSDETDYPMADRYCNFDPAELTGITFGKNIGKEHREKLMSIIARRPTQMQCFDAVAGGQFQIEFVPFDKCGGPSN